MTTRRPEYGRRLDDFVEGEIYPHPWEVTIDGGTIALFQASFLDATPTYASERFARALGFAARPVHPLLLMNLGLSFSVHDVSEQAIAHLAYVDIRFPQPCYAGDTVFASSKVLGIKPSRSGDKGVVHVRTVLENQDGTVVCVFERKALVRAGRVEGRPMTTFVHQQPDAEDSARLPPPLRHRVAIPTRRGGFAGFYEDFGVGDILLHQVGKTVGESEHMQLTLLMRNSHPIHFDEHYCEEGKSFTGTRVVYGGLVFGFCASLASRDTCGNVVWDLGWDDGAHPAGVIAGDTLYAASTVLDKRDHDETTGEVTFRLVGVKNARPDAILAEGKDLFAPERGKDAPQRVEEKVFEITRRVLMLKTPS